MPIGFGHVEHRRRRGRCAFPEPSRRRPAARRAPGRRRARAGARRAGGREPAGRCRARPPPRARGQELRLGGRSGRARDLRASARRGTVDRRPARVRPVLPARQRRGGVASRAQPAALRARAADPPRVARRGLRQARRGRRRACRAGPASAQRLARARDHCASHRGRPPHRAPGPAAAQPYPRGTRRPGARRQRPAAARGRGHRRDHGALAGRRGALATPARRRRDSPCAVVLRDDAARRGA